MRGGEQQRHRAPGLEPSVPLPTSGLGAAAATVDAGPSAAIPVAAATAVLEPSRLTALITLRQPCRQPCRQRRETADREEQQKPIAQRNVADPVHSAPPIAATIGDRGGARRSLAASQASIRSGSRSCNGSELVVVSICWCAFRSRLPTRRLHSMCRGWLSHPRRAGILPGHSVTDHTALPRSTPSSGVRCSEPMRAGSPR